MLPRVGVFADMVMLSCMLCQEWTQVMDQHAKKLAVHVKATPGM